MSLGALTILLIGQRVVPIWALARTRELGAPTVWLGAGLLASGIFERVMRAKMRIRVASAVHRHALDALLERGAARREDEAHIDSQHALFTALEATEELVVNVSPTLAADIVSLAIVVPWVLVQQGSAPIEYAAITLPLVLGVLMLLGIWRSRTARWLSELETSYGRVVDGIVTALRAREELVLNGAETRLRARSRSSTTAWTRASIRWTALQFLLGRAPLALVVAALGAFVALRDPGTFAWQSGIVWAALATLLVSASTGAHRALLAWTRARRGATILEGERFASRPSDLAQSAGATVEARGVSYRFPGTIRDVLSDLTFTWTPGSVVLVKGANGSGKSTLLRLAAGALGATTGTLLRIGAGLGYLSASPFLPDGWTAREAISLYAEGFSESDAILRTLGVGGSDATVDLDARIETLSLGQKQRVAIARVLLRRAAVLLLDEPDSHLDASTTEALGTLLRELSLSRVVVIAAHGEGIRNAIGPASVLDLSTPLAGRAGVLSKAV